MKFGRSLPRNQVPEWASSYINYKGLKKLIKNAAANSQQTGEPDLAGFFHALDRNLEDVDHFYLKKFHDFSRRLKLLEERYSSTKEGAAELEPEDREDLLAALLELRGQLRKLQWYGEVNRRGFIKITKKLDKKILSANAQKKYLALKVDPSAFATNAELFSTLSGLNEWISLLSDATSSTASNISGDDRSSVTSHSLRQSSSRQKLRIPNESFALIEQQIRQDDAIALRESLDSARAALSDTPEHAYQVFLNGLLQRAIFSRARKSVAYLLQQVVFLDADDINRRNCIHRLVVSIGRAQSSMDREVKAELFPDAESELYSFITPAMSPLNPFKPAVAQEERHLKYLTRSDDAIAFLDFLLSNLQPTQRSALASRDSGGRTALHFAAEHGVDIMCQVIIDYLKKWNMFEVKQGIDGPEWQDIEGFAPLHLSVAGGHPLTTQTLLHAESVARGEAAVKPLLRVSSKSAGLLSLATKANFIEVVRTLVQAGFDVNHQDDQGETALHVAARFGHDECAQILLEGSSTQKASTETAEATYAWTPLFIAAVDGHLSIINLLIEAGAELEKADSSGWTAKEHAALRGHIDIAERLSEVTPEPESELRHSRASSTSPPSASSLADRKSNIPTSQLPVVKPVDTIRTFGHRFLTDKAMILVSLGSMDMRKPRQTVNLDRIPLTNASSTQLDTALSIVVSAKSAEGEPEVIDLPVHDNISTEPITFHTADPSKVKILFDLVPTYAGNHERIVGRAVAMLSSVKTNLGSKRMPLQGDVTVPIVAAGDLEVIGSVTFNFLIITPFHHPKMSVSTDQTYWKSVASTMVIGHRGLGKNIAGRKSLQLGENTIESFIAAANLGASYVEFDVQLTKDHVPVIYHDFLVSETGIDAPVHTLTLEQFLHVNDSRTPRPSRPASPAIPPENPRMGSIRNGDPRSNRMRSMSVGDVGGNETVDMEERMKHTRDFKKKGFKGNSRGNHIQAPFATLEEMFRKLPQSVGFNIEMKYPMLSESEDEEMDHYAVELNSFVDTVLSKVYDLGTGRNILFSSFNPDICLLLNHKQPSIPVLFLTDAGTSPVGDIRASSLQEAIRFASRWNLLGIVAAAEPFVMAPRLVRVVKESGLVCVSYGTMNNENDKVRLQVNQGIDAVIVDSVLAIRKGLTGRESQLKPASASLLPPSSSSTFSLSSTPTRTPTVPGNKQQNPNPSQNPDEDLSIAVPTHTPATVSAAEAVEAEAEANK